MAAKNLGLLWLSAWAWWIGTSFLLSCVEGYKDDSYYMAGKSNPNIKQKMYWKDAENVLQDLSKFKALYVQFSGCAWTWMQMEEADNDVDENGECRHATKSTNKVQRRGFT